MDDEADGRRARDEADCVAKLGGCGNASSVFRKV